MGEMLPTDELRKDHQSLLQDLGELQASVREMSAGELSAQGRVGGALRARFDMFQQTLLLHFRREEEGLFPEAQRMISEGARRADVLGQFFAGEAEDDMAAHSVLSSRTREVISLLETTEQSGEFDRQSLGRLRTLVELTRNLFDRHADKEDKLIFPLLETGLSLEQMEEVRQRMQVFRASADLTDPRMRQGDYLTELRIQDE